MRVAIYARQSQTRDDTLSASIEAQVDACRDVAEQHGWTVVEVYTDTNTPADAVDKRKALAELLVAAEAGLIDCVLAYDTSRLWRRVDIGSALREKMRDAGVTHLATLAGIESLDYTPEALAMRQVRDVFSELDNNIRSAKLRDVKAAGARKGKANGGGCRPYGWMDHARSAVDETEAAIIREVADRIVKGESSSFICHDLYRRGVLTSTGRPWRRPSLVRMLRSPALMGKRKHHDELHAAVWDPILDELTFGMVQRVLDQRAKDRPGGNGKPGLLSGIGVLYCGICGATMSKSVSKSGKQVYRCYISRGAVNCSRIWINAAELEAHVAEELTNIIPYRDIASWRAAAQDPKHMELIAEIERREALMDELADDRDAGLISRGKYLDRMRKNSQELDVIRAQVAELEGTDDDLMAFLYGEPRDDFIVVASSTEVPEDQREDFRRALRAFVERIEVHPAAQPSSGRVDLGRVIVTPKRAVPMG
jgi:DNA invertase Pin-like site-specific DNA recombinase